MRANATYLEVKHQFSDRNKAVLMNVQSPHKWWSTLKSAVFGTSSSLPPLVSEGSGLLYESVDLLLTCHPSPSLNTFEFRSRGQASLVRLGPSWWH